MDEGRFHDLNRLTMVLHNPDESDLHKRQASRAMEKIKKKMRDPFLRKQRERLIRAHQAQDSAEAEKISDIISEYERRTYGRV